MSLQKKIAGLILSHLTWKDIKIYVKPWHGVILPSCCLANIKNAGAKKFSLCMPSLPVPIISGQAGLSQGLIKLPFLAGALFYRR